MRLVAPLPWWMADPTTEECACTSFNLRPSFACCGKRSWYGTVRKNKKKVLLWPSPRSGRWQHAEQRQMQEQVNQKLWNLRVFEKISRTLLRKEKCLSSSPFGKSMAPWLTYYCSSSEQNEQGTGSYIYVHVLLQSWSLISLQWTVTAIRVGSQSISLTWNGWKRSILESIRNSWMKTMLLADQVIHISQ